MGYEMPDRPKFLERAMQGLAFWVGHRAALFGDYPLPEAALVTEMCNLMQVGLDRDQKLCPEVMYKRFMDIGGTALTDQARADIVVMHSQAPDPYSNDVRDAVQFVFEVKRASSTKASIDDDLRRLLSFKQKCHAGARAFLIVAAEKTLPGRFVDEEKGSSRLHPHEIPNTTGFYCVRRTVKAAASFEKKESANYVCIIEVFSVKPKRGDLQSLKL